MHSALALLSLLPLTSAHFLLSWPPARGFDDSTAPNFPCGGFDTVLSNRTTWPATGGPIQLDMHHTQTVIEVLIALGSDPGVNYNIVMRPTFLQQGPRDFCIGMVSVPSSVNITEGMPATIQVVSNGDDGGSGGLYQVRLLSRHSRGTPNNANPNFNPNPATSPFPIPLEWLRPVPIHC